MNRLRGRVKKVYQCTVEEDNKRCSEHFEAYLDREDIMEIGSSRYICKEHTSMGYCWLSQVMSDKNVKIEDIGHYENIDGKWTVVGTETIGVRNEELYTRPQDIAIKQGTRVRDLTTQQASTANRGRDVLRGYGVVAKYEDDTLLIPLDDTTNPDSPTVQRKAKTIVGFAQARPPKPGDVF